ncbi:MAG TPA: hypothetical protein VGP93_19150, partial [Polyangiaceae bacterium]|nr:hypothetical protein [Polyangiaceae bacterium]
MKKRKDRPGEMIELSVFRPVPKGLPQGRSQTLPLERIEPVIRIAHRRTGPSLTFGERVIVDHELVLIISGNGELRFRDGVVPFASHDLLFVRPFVPHAFAGRGHVDHIAVHFDFSPLGDEADLENREPYVVEIANAMTLPTKQRAVPDGPVERSLALVVEHFARATAEGKMRARGEFLCVLSALLVPQGREQSHLGRRRARLERVVTLMRERIADHLTSADLERASGLGSSQLNALFRELVGCSPMEYLRRL